MFHENSTQKSVCPILAPRKVGTYSLWFEEGFEKAVGLLELLGAVLSKEGVDSLPQNSRV